MDFGQVARKGEGGEVGSVCALTNHRQGAEMLRSEVLVLLLNNLYKI